MLRCSGSANISDSYYKHRNHLKIPINHTTLLLFWLFPGLWLSATATYLSIALLFFFFCNVSFIRVGICLYCILSTLNSTWCSNNCNYWLNKHVLYMPCTGVKSHQSWKNKIQRNSFRFCQENPTLTDMLFILFNINIPKFHYRNTVIWGPHWYVV